jgi:A/G-specific adenine glycosylase
MSTLKSVDTEKINYFREKLQDWSKDNLRTFPWRNTSDTYELLVAEIMLQQTDTEQVVPVYQEFINQFPDIESLNDADHDQIDAHISKIGLNYRTERLKNIASVVISRWEGEPPNEPEKLKSLPGIGKYIAHSVASVADNKPLAVIDTNFIRIFKRFFGIESDNQRPRTDNELWKFANKMLPESSDPLTVPEWNWTVLDFGALICTHHNPNCNKCPVSDKCSYYQESEMKKDVE